MESTTGTAVARAVTRSRAMHWSSTAAGCANYCVAYGRFSILGAASARRALDRRRPDDSLACRLWSAVGQADAVSRRDANGYATVAHESPGRWASARIPEAGILG